jgi:hypothetical protein
MNLEDLDSRQAPACIRYSNIVPLGLQARARKSKFFPTNAGVFSNTGNNIIRIPISSSTQFLDGTQSYLKFTFRNDNANANAYQFDGSAHSLFNRIRVLSKSGGADLEDYREHDQTHCMLSDLCLTNQERFTRAHEGYGYSGLYQPAAATQSTATSLCTGEPSIAQNGSFVCVLPLLSSLLGAGQSKYLPLFLTGELILELQLNSNAVFGTNADVAKYSLLNVEYHAHLLEFNSAINDTLTSMTLKTGLYIHGTGWSTLKTAIGGNTSAQILITEKLKSVKSAFVTFSGNPANFSSRSLARHHAFVNGIRLKIGSEYYPTSYIGNGSDRASLANENGEYISETFKAIAEYNNKYHKSLVNSENFAGTDSVIGSVGRAVYGFDLDAFTKQPLESGINTIMNSPIMIDITASAQIPALNCFCHLLHDVLFVIKPDGSFVAVK